MRRGESLRPWTVAEERRLREMAGRVPRREIAWRLRRSNESVRQKAKRMGLSLRCWEPRCAQTLSLIHISTATAARASRYRAPPPPPKPPPPPPEKPPPKPPPLEKLPLAPEIAA